MCHGNGKAEAVLAGPVYHTDLGGKSLQEKGRREGRIRPWRMQIWDEEQQRKKQKLSGQTKRVRSSDAPGMWVRSRTCCSLL